MTKGTKKRNQDNLSGPNLGYIQEQYERYTNNPESVEPTIRELFDQSDELPSISDYDRDDPLTETVDKNIGFNKLKTVVAANKLVWNIRTYGHLDANTDPLELRKKADTRNLEPESFKLDENSLSAIPASLIWDNASEDEASGWDAIQRLREIYTSSIAYEFDHVHDNVEREWLNEYVETGASKNSLS